MSWLRKLRIPDTASSVRAVGGPLFKLPWASRKETAEAQVFDTSRRLAEIELDRIILFKGKWHLPPVTVKPRFEAWNHVRLEPETKPEPDLLLTDPKIRNIFRTRNPVLVAAALLGFVGIRYYLRQQRRKRFQDTVANAAAASVQDAIAQAFQGAINQAVRGAANQAFPAATMEVFRGTAVQEAIAEALKNAADVAIGQAAKDVAASLKDLQGTLVEALKDETVKDIIAKAARDALTPVRTSNLTTEEVLKACLEAEGLKEIDLKALLGVLSLEYSPPKLEGRDMELKDIITSSVKELVGYGIPQGHAVKMKNAALYLLDLHYTSFA